MTLRLLLLTLLLPLTAQAQDRLLSPAEFLGYTLGEQFTPHHRVVDYLAHVAAASPNVRLEPYGESYEGRPLLTAFVTTPGNLGRLEAIREDNLRRAGLLPGEPAGETAIVWLSYNVHGNESVSTEAAMATLYDLANPANARTQRWLDNTVVVIDPCINPDGRERYVQWYRQARGRTPNARPAAWEHHEPWPGGRTNHYYFDLNRDWAWMTQQETQQRLEIYNRWLPHVHVDFHEQGVDEPYYFAPAAEPFHESITPFQRDFQTEIGANHARYFDAEGWLYFTRQRFDLFYPGYGDTWPTFNGAVGMTYEQGGSGRAGLAIRTAEGDTLTLAERIAHHHTTGLSTVEATAQNHRRVVQQFAAYFADARNAPPGVYRTYVVTGQAAPDRLEALARHLDAQGIAYGFAENRREARGFAYATGRDERFTVEAGDLVVSAYQPKSVLAKVLLEPRSALEDSVTYDITAWALPYAYGLEAYASPERLAPGVPAPPRAAAPAPQESQPYAYLAAWRSLDDARFLAALLETGLKLRFAEQPFEVDGRAFAPGTLIITRKGNAGTGDFDTTVGETAARFGQALVPVESGFVTRGADFGSSDVPFLRRPEVAVLAGEEISSAALGEVWHFFDQVLRYPLTLLPTDDFEAADLTLFDVLILPSGSYSKIFPDEKLPALKEWIRGGGRLIALERAVSFLAGKDGFALKKKATGEAADSLAAPRQRRYGERERQNITGEVPGSIFRVEMDATHPLGFGLDRYFTLKRSDAAFAFLDDGWNVGVLRADSHVSGFTGYRAKAALQDVLNFGVQEMGRGEVVYLVDDPLFRGFWYTGQLLFANAVFLVGQSTPPRY